MKTLLSLFDYSGAWSRPYALNGWNVHQWDIKLSEFMDINSIDSAETALELFENVDGIIAAPPCTHFTASGAQYWTIKDEDGRTWEMLELVNQVARLADLFTPTDLDFIEENDPFFWAVENPVGRLSKLTGWDKPFYFNPCDFAGWTEPTTAELLTLDAIRVKDGIDVLETEVDLVKEINCYTKKTGLWGEFNRDLEKKPVEAVKCSPQGSFTQRYGGDSVKTKEQRSNTPEGFAWAFYNANH
tara:strand:- start:1032 stop:1760 length:729 start_codon:yes stop_codon:yes gene_type:complete